MIDGPSGQSFIDEHEQKRLAALYRYRVLDSPPEPAFDRLTRLAAQICNTPFATINLIDRDRHWIKASLDGVQPDALPLVLSFCVHTIQQQDVYIIPDLATDPRFMDNPLVHDESGMRFYAGAPIRTSDGHNIGTLCVIDAQPRTLVSAQIAALVDLAAVVMDTLDLRLQLSERTALEAERSAALRRAEASETKYKTLFNVLPLGVTLTDTQGQVLESNPMSERLLGLDADTDDANEPHQCRIDGPGLTIIDPTGAPLPVAEYASVRALREQRLVEEMEMGIVKSGGQTTWLSVTAMPIPLADYGVVIVYRDITNRREAEQALRRSEERYALAVAGANDGLWDWDITTDTMYISPRGNVILGLPVTTGVSSAMWRDRVHLDDWPGVEAQLQAHLSGVTPHFHSEHRMVHVDGQTRWMLTRGLCVFDSVGRPLRMAGSLTDITYQKQTEYVLREAKAQAEAANIAKSAFLATMSHELRTPLNAILGYSELLMDNGHLPENDEVRTGIQRIYRAGSHLRALIDDVLDLSKVEADRMELHLEPFLLGQVLDSIVSTVEPLVRQNDNVLRVVCDEKLGIMHADQTKVRQIVLNVLGNAAKFTTAGVITLTCERLERDGREVVCFVIADTGIGMTVEQLTRLFQPFVQAEAATTRRYGGTGLGLALSQRLCRLMGGEITVESREGVGTTCTIELPVMVEKGYLAGRSLP